MSYNYYCYGQVQTKDGKWKEFSKHPFADNLKYYIDFNDLPDCFERVTWSKDDTKVEGIASEIVDRFKDSFSYTEAYLVRLDKYLKYYSNKFSMVKAKIETIIKCMGVEGDINWGELDECIYNLLDLNNKKLDKKTVPISYLAAIELLKCIHEFNMYKYLLDIAKVFETMSYDIDDFSNEKKSFFIIME